MADEDATTDWVALGRVLDGTDPAEALTGETRLEYERIVRAGSDEEPQNATAAELGADEFHAEINAYIGDVAADLEAKGIDPNGPESHDYYAAVEALR
jgi:hypothetical protein